MKKEIDMMLDYLTKITKDESDLISSVISWTDEYKIAFKLAKEIFEEDLTSD